MKLFAKNTPLPSSEKYISESFRRTVLINLIGSVGMLICLVFGIDAFFRDQTEYGIFLTCVFVVGISLLFLLWKLKIYTFASYAAATLMFLVNCYLILVLARTDYTAPLWHFISPPFLLFATNRKIGSIYIGLLLCVTIYAFEFIPELQEQFDAFYKIRFYGVLISIILLAYIYEIIRDRTYQAFINSNEQKTIALQKVLDQKEEILQQTEEIETQNNLILETNIKLEKTNRMVTDSIQYARTIQDAILPDEEILRRNFTDHFILYEPKNIVSGDFYWFAEVDDYLFVAIADCTGHGVPGAFMAMIGNTLLNEIVKAKHVHHPGDILYALNYGIQHALGQRGGKLPDDGMDITLCRFDSSNSQLEISCANHFMYIIDNETSIESEGRIKIIQGGFFSIGDKPRKGIKIEYQSERIALKEGLSIYLFTDGYSDQFGGPDLENGGKKFMSKRFKNLLLENQQLSMEEQKNILSSAFLKWKGDQTQIDDVLVVGIRT